MNNSKGLNFGFIGVGQCGGNIANEFNKLGYKAIAINTAKSDLAKLNNIQKNNKLLINTGVEGAGKNPELGKKALEEHIEDVMYLINLVFDETVDMIYVCAGLGGGTGSGIAPLLSQILTEQGIGTGVITTFPSETESPKVQIVALNAFEGLSHIEKLGSLFIVDNAKAIKLPEEMGLKTKYGIINENIANKLDKLNEITTRASDMSFDARDFETLLGTRGFSIISSITIEDITELKEVEVLAQNVRTAVNDSIYANTDHQYAKGAAFLFELPDGGSNYITERAIEKMQGELGTPFEIFTGMYEDKKRKREVTLHILVTGLPFPKERLVNVQEKLEEQASKIENLFNTSQNQVFTGNGKSLLDKFVHKPQQKEQPIQGESTLDKLLKKKKQGG